MCCIAVVLLSLYFTLTMHITIQVHESNLEYWSVSLTARIIIRKCYHKSDKVTTKHPQIITVCNWINYKKTQRTSIWTYFTAISQMCIIPD